MALGSLLKKGPGNRHPSRAGVAFINIFAHAHDKKRYWHTAYGKWRNSFAPGAEVKLTIFNIHAQQVLDFLLEIVGEIERHSFLPKGVRHVAFHFSLLVI